MTESQGEMYRQSVTKLAIVTDSTEDWARAILARLASDPDPWLLVADHEMADRYELREQVEALTKRTEGHRVEMEQIAQDRDRWRTLVEGTVIALDSILNDDALLMDPPARIVFNRVRNKLKAECDD